MPDKHPNSAPNGTLFSPLYNGVQGAPCTSFASRPISPNNKRECTIVVRDDAPLPEGRLFGKPTLRLG